MSAKAVRVLKQVTPLLAEIVDWRLKHDRANQVDLRVLGQRVAQWADQNTVNQLHDDAQALTQLRAKPEDLKHENEDPI